jgi:hypothetical protein
MDRSAGDGEDDLPVYEEDLGSEVDEDGIVNIRVGSLHG